MVALPLVEPSLTYVVGLVCADRDPPAPLAKALAATAAERGMAQQIEAATNEALEPWLCSVDPLSEAAEQSPRALIGK
jgi:hypothetical protein